MQKTVAQHPHLTLVPDHGEPADEFIRDTAGWMLRRGLPADTDLCLRPDLAAAVRSEVARLSAPAPRILSAVT